MKTTTVTIRVSLEDKREMERLAIMLGHSLPDGEGNISAYLRAAHRLVKQELKRGRILGMPMFDDEAHPGEAHQGEAHPGEAHPDEAQKTSASSLFWE